MSEIITVHNAEDARIDKWLSDDQDISRAYVKKLIDEGRITVNGVSVKSSYKVSESDEIIIDYPELTSLDILPEDIPLDIVYEDDDIILINKPKGMVVHPAPGHYTGTVVNALLFHCKGNLSGINGVERPGIVHRIDKDTTGIIIACKNDNAHQSIAGQLEEHSINRRYRAIVHGNIKEDEGTVKGNIDRHPKDRKKMAVVMGKGRRAVTHYKVLERFGDYTYIECRLETGRTHQIRVHMAHIKHPVLGDEIYGAKSEKYKTDGQVLHAMTFGFEHPKTGEYMEFSADIPDYFKHILEVLRNR